MSATSLNQKEVNAYGPIIVSSNHYSEIRSLNNETIHAYFQY